MSHPTAITPEGWRIGGGFSEFLHGVGHGDLDDDIEATDDEWAIDQALYDDAEESRRQSREEREWDR